MLNTLTANKKARSCLSKGKAGNSQKEKNQSIKVEQQNKESLVCVKNFQSKFIGYLDELNSSIQNCKRKTNKKCEFLDDRKKSSQSISGNTEASCQDPVSKYSKKSTKSVQKKRSFVKQYTVIQGEKINGKVHGKAILELSNSAIFTGFVEQGQIKEGQMVFKDLSQYKGGFKNSLFHGPGVLKLVNGTIYKVNFIYGSMEKDGQIIYNNGDVYKGQILKYKKHGHGQLLFNNGNRYIGNFRQGEISGFGTYYINQFPVAQGMWLKGQFLQKISQNNSLSEQIIDT